MAKLYFRYGAMNSGKTALLLQAAYNYEQRGMKTLVLKPAIDTKGGDYIVSRIGLERKIDHSQIVFNSSIEWAISNNLVEPSNPSVLKSVLNP